MTKEEKLQAEEQIMNAVCEPCHWPYAYPADNEDAMYDEKCSVCPAALAVNDVLARVSL